MREAIKTIGRFSKEWLFIVLASVMVLITGTFVIYCIIFLGSSLNDALSAPAARQTHLQFDIKGFQSLNLIQK